MNTPHLPELRGFAELLAVAQSTSSRNDKQAAVAAALASSNGPGILKLLQYALSPYTRFFVQQLPAVGGECGVPTVNMAIIYGTLDALSSRRITGEAAKTAIAMMLALVTDHVGIVAVSDREALRRVLLKDLRAGFDAGTVNRAKKGSVLVFECQLAEDASKVDLSTLTYPIVVEPKYDGVRTIAVKRDGIVTLFSRNGIPFENFEEIRLYLETEMPDEFVFDGEVMHSTLLGPEGYKKVMKRAKAKTGTNTDVEVRYQAFDGMSVHHWDSQGSFGYLDRRSVVGAMDSVMKLSPLFSTSPYTLAVGSVELEALYRGYVDDGYEGIIAKRPDAVYRFKRSSDWLKVKPFATADLVVTAITEGAGKYAGSLGTLVCEGIIDGKTINVEVGSGFSDAIRASIWANPGEAIGRYIEVRYQDITIANGSVTHSLRFPTFLWFRKTDAAGKI